MAKPKIRTCDQGTAYAAALESGSKTGMAHATDAEVMAGFCNDTLQLLAGAVSGRLVWEGAQARGMTSRELLKIVHARDWDALDELQFGDAPPAIRVDRYSGDGYPGDDRELPWLGDPDRDDGEIELARGDD